MKLILPLIMVAALPMVLASCSKEVPCAICYEDEWSREPFPGQTKQHIKPLEPKDVKNGMPAVHNEFVDVMPASTPGTERW